MTTLPAPADPSTARARRTALGAALALAAGAVLANAAFVGLGGAFDYPDVLLRPTAEILDLFQASRGTVMAWFAVLAAGAALLGPGAVLLGRLGRGRAARWSVRAGVAAAVVQVIGLSRWFLVVPGLAATATDPSADPAARSRAVDRFELAHTVLGRVIGETLGYALTAAWTVLVVVALRELVGGRVARTVGVAAAGLIALGILTPLGVPGTDLANFVGYVVWSVWVVALAVRLVRRHRGPVAPVVAVTHALVAG